MVIDTARPGFLRDLGFFGLEGLESALLAGLFTGEPVLLVGAHGSAKTALARALAAALGRRFHAYDAAKALFEDIIGFPSPRALSEGRVEYVPTPLSIWDREFVLVDEISRAAPSMQNKWLEVVRARQVMGRAVSGLTHVFAAMNPPGYLGAHPLDAALAGRFAFVLRLPEARELESADLAAVVENLTADDAPGCRPLFAALGGARSAAPVDLPGLLARMRARAADGFAAHAQPVRRYVTGLAQALRAAEVFLDGRRLGMLRRNLLAVLLAEEVQGADLVEERYDIFLRTLRQSLPDAALGQETAEELLVSAHHAALRAAEGAEGDASALLGRLAGAEPLETVAAYARGLAAEVGGPAALSEDEHHGVLNRVLEALEDDRPERRADGVAALLRFLGVAGEHAGWVPADVLGRAMERYRRLAGHAGQVFLDVQHALAVDGLTDLDPGGSADGLAIRAALDLAWDDDGFGGRGRLDLEQLEHLLEPLLRRLRRRLGAPAAEGMAPP